MVPIYTFTIFVVWLWAAWSLNILSVDKTNGSLTSSQGHLNSFYDLNKFYPPLFILTPNIPSTMLKHISSSVFCCCCVFPLQCCGKRPLKASLKKWYIGGGRVSSGWYGFQKIFNIHGLYIVECPHIFFPGFFFPRECSPPPEAIFFSTLGNLKDSTLDEKKEIVTKRFFWKQQIH